MWIVEPLQQLDRGAFATAAAPHQGHGLSTLHVQTQVV